MTASDQPRRHYAGRGISKLPGSRSGAAAPLPGPDEATLLPDPRDAYERMRLRFIEANGVSADSSPKAPRPRLAASDVMAIANHLTYALRNDLPTIDANDAAVIWEKWRVAVNDLRDLLRNIPLENDTPYAAVLLDHRTWDVHESLATALQRPGEVFERSCPWRSAWATPARIHPEAS